MMPARRLLVFLVLAATSALATPDLSLALSGMPERLFFSFIPMTANNRHFTGPESVDGVGNLKMTATLTNRGDETVKILNDPKSVLSTSACGQLLH
ncbi:hypothetical protein CYLTODRAFT_418997 [Cylindrobasidium torrendii FP15055 ss-10]|uniref:Uncharacterized protein n=1 Tax=Cylindrobasidium torrendii FP15055 ss-10 TaxID=1314674 RepID=A0A0D7BL84_9AGAR|nr:hypothetical protein CYLTODRAFT_418997 [Cylindrobasidium torrendii FP15055 ss-10]